MRKSRALVLSIWILVSGCTTAPTPPVVPGMQAPEAASGYQDKPGWHASRFMVSAAHPLAADAGSRMLRAGGSAVDAAIAVQMVLTLVEPQSSGIGGGAFLMHFDGETVEAYDGRETAPAAAGEDLFKDADGKTLPFRTAVVGGRAVGVPGVLHMLALAHKRHGKLPWAELFAPAIALAEDGFPVSPRLHALLEKDQHLKQDPVAAAYFYDSNGRPWPVGHRLRNPDLAATLREIADGGVSTFYTGAIARAIVDKVRSHAANPGLLTMADFSRYRARQRDPVCNAYRKWTVCGMPPPSSGGIAVAQILGILEHTPIASLKSEDGQAPAKAIHLFSEAGRLAYADRARYVADTDFVPLPGNSPAPLLDTAYLARRAALIGERSMGTAEAGEPVTRLAARGRDTAPELPSTSHVSVVDAHGNALAMTTSIEDAFGARQMVRGFLL
ncbi:MAG TPA: gamma-glutamyltransferase family protein, partial [Noviherbaspirillum sp.]